SPPYSAPSAKKLSGHLENVKGTYRPSTGASIRAATGPVSRGANPWAHTENGDALSDQHPGRPRRGRDQPFRDPRRTARPPLGRPRPARLALGLDVRRLADRAGRARGVADLPGVAGGLPPGA